jgi:nitrogen fixation/metabolism regulation signal transduction histidine kinase
MATSIQISERLHKELIKRKLFDRETYEEVIWDLIENTQELSEETKKELEEARAEIKAGKYHTLAEVKKELGL